MLIEGDNYYALKALQISGIKVDVIYIDPPYNTGNKDFVYEDHYVDKEDKFKHSKWLTFMKNRLILAKELLADDGVIFISIDDNEQAYLKVLMDEIFGEENFSNQINWISNKKGRQISNNLFAKTYEYILVYSNNINLNSQFKINREFAENNMPSIYIPKNTELITDETSEFIIQNELHNTNINYFNERTRPNLFFPIYTNGEEISLEYQNGFTKLLPPKNSNGTYAVWRWSKEKIEKDKNDLYIKSDGITYSIFTKKRNIEYLIKDIILSPNITTKSASSELEKISINFDYSKPSKLLKLLFLNTNKNSIVLDFFAGSGTTGQAVMELNEEDGGNRRFILCTNNENNIARDVCRERLYRIINGVGSKNEQIDWKYSSDEPFLKNNSVKYLKVKPIHKINGEYEEINDMKELYQKEFRKNLSIKDFK